MKSNGNQEVFPIAIFLDTNILDSLPENLRSGDLSGLIADANSIGAKVYVPDVVAREWLKHRIDKFFNSLEEYEKSKAHIKKYFSSIPGFDITEDGFSSNVCRFLISHLKKSGCRILGPPKSTISSLTKRAVWSRPPFRNANKGFKDELVVLSMLKLPKRGWNYRTYVLVTQDNDFPAEELKKRFADFNVVLERVTTLQDARKLLDKKLDAAWKQQNATLEAEVKGFLSRHWDTISQAVVRNAEEKGVSLWLIYGYGQKDIPEGSCIRRLVKTTPKEIQHVDVGVEDEVTREIPVTIGVETKLSLEVEGNPYRYRAIFETIGTEGRKSSQSPSSERQLTTIDINRQIYIYAVVKRDRSGALAEYELVDMRPDLRKTLEGIDKKRKNSQ